MFKSLFASLVIVVMALASVTYAHAALLAPEDEVLPNAAVIESVVSYPEVEASLSEQRSRYLAQGDFGLTDTARSAGLENVGDKNLSKRIGQIIYAALGFVGVIFLVYTIYGGFLWMTAGGNTQKTSEGAAHIRNGAIGIIIILSSYAITFFVLDLVTSSGSSSSTTASQPCMPTYSCLHPTQCSSRGGTAVSGRVCGYSGDVCCDVP